MRRPTRIALARNPLQEDLLGGLDSFVAAIFGETFEPEQDGPRLTSQQKRVEQLMADGQWRTLPAIVKELHKLYRVQCGEASVSARLRDMRRVGWKIERQRTGANSGLFAYRAVKNGAAEEAIEPERTAGVLHVFTHSNTASEASL